MDKKTDIPLIESLFKRLDVRERAIKAFILSCQGANQREIGKIIGVSRTTANNYLGRIKKAGAVLHLEGVEELKQKYIIRKELLIREGFKDLTSLGDDPKFARERSQIRREISHHLDTLADAFWRTAKKEEKVSEESPLSLVREWVHSGKLPGDEP